MQLGGMALRDGVLLQSDGYWAAAVREESGGVKVVSGAKVRLPGREALRQVPVVRGVVRLGEAMAVLPAVRRATGKPVLPQEDPRLLAATAASAVATVALRASRRGSPVLRELAVAGVGLAPVLLALRDSRLSRYHGAEHKSVAAYETGGVAATADKEHARCGSNLIAPMVVDQPRHQPGAARGRQGAAAVGDVSRGPRQHRHRDGTVLMDVAPPGPPAGADSWQARHRDAAPVHDQRTL